MLEVEHAKLALEQADPEIFQLIEEEERYQVETVRLIPSENYVSEAVLQASGSVGTVSWPSSRSPARCFLS